jgi:hypothetical protein
MAIESHHAWRGLAAKFNAWAGSARRLIRAVVDICCQEGRFPPRDSNNMDQSPSLPLARLWAEVLNAPSVEGKVPHHVYRYLASYFEALREEGSSLAGLPRVQYITGKSVPAGYKALIRLRADGAYHYTDLGLWVQRGAGLQVVIKTQMGDRDLLLGTPIVYTMTMLPFETPQDRQQALTQIGKDIVRSSAVRPRAPQYDRAS